MSALTSLQNYAKKVFDVNNDGIVDIKDFFRLFPSQAVAIAVIFVDLVVLASEYRVWDVGIQITDGDVIKALGFVLVSAVPFLLGQVFWLNPFANWFQKRVGEIFVLSSLYIGWLFGTADLSKNYDTDFLVGAVVTASSCYILLSLFYILIDERIKAWRLRQQIKAKLTEERLLLSLTRESLKDVQETQLLKSEIENEYGEGVVDEQLNRFRGKSSKSPNQ